METSGIIALVGGGNSIAEIESLCGDFLNYKKDAHGHVVFVFAVAWHEVELEKRIEPAKAMLTSVFQKFGAESEFIVLRDRSHANELQNVRLLEKADVICIYGGTPDVYLECLRNTAIWEAILNGHRQGSMIMGVSAGAMILGEVCLIAGNRTYNALDPTSPPDVWADGLQVISGVGIAPHFNSLSEPWTAKIKADCPPHIRFMGIDNLTGLAYTGGEWHVIGSGQVHLRTPDGEKSYSPGSKFVL